jgi:glyoxylate/hydroxypyruvate reductase
MSLCVLFAAGEDSFAEYEAPLLAAFAAAGLAVRLVTDAAPESVDYIIYAPSSPVQDFTPFTRCKAVLSLWAGVERIVGNPTLTQPLARMVDPALTRGMVEYVCGHVLRYHLGMDAHIRALPGTWEPAEPPLAPERRVGILGLGELGRACARALADFGFDVAGWSARPKALAGIACHHGPEGLEATLRHAEILVTLLPQTRDTDCILNARSLALLPRGARIINPGRGGLVEDAALLAALQSGQIGAATLDVFRVEPLPADHPFWADPRVTVTPHIAATTRAPSAAQVIVGNIARSEQGAALLHIVNRARGY